MIFATTHRLNLRALAESDLPRLAELIGDWEVVRWLVKPPYPYTLKDAKAFYAKMQESGDDGANVCFVIADRAHDLLMGIVALHPDRTAPQERDRLEIGYWLGRDFWGHGYMSEAVAAALDLGFRRPPILKIVSTTDPANAASKNVLRKAGFACLGVHTRDTVGFQRGSADAMCWELTRDAYRHGRAAS